MENLNSTTIPSLPMKNEGPSQTRKSSSSNLVWSDYIQIASFACLLTIGAFMNLISFIYFGFRKTRFKSNYRYFIAHLSFADLTCCLMTPVFTITVILNNEQWIFGDIACNYIYPMARLSGSLSAWILCGMTYERYRAFTNPFHKLRKRMIHIYMVIVYLIYITYSLVYSIHPRSKKHAQCSHSNRSKTVYLNIIKTNIKIAVPSIIIITLCIRLKIFLRNNNDVINTSNNDTSTGANSHQNETQTIRVQRRKDKSEKMVLYSAASYLVCVLPAYVVQIVSCVFILTGQPKYLSNKDIRWALIFFYANSVINVFIYAGRFKDFRKFIFEILHLSK